MQTRVKQIEHKGTVELILPYALVEQLDEERKETTIKTSLNN